MSREHRPLVLVAAALCLPTLGGLAGLVATVGALAVLLRSSAKNPIPPAPSFGQVTALVTAVAILLLPAAVAPEAGLAALGWLLGPCFLLAAPFALWLFRASFRGKV
ncbi:MAG: hypothetical protein ACUVRQ_02255 [Thermoanaerobaculaceae bacterium]